MSNTIAATGNCLCGAITVNATISNQLGACHCKMCRRWSGAPLLSVEVVDNLHIQGEEHIALYNSSEWAERAFCKGCGSHLFYKLKEANKYYVPIGLFDNLTGIEFKAQIFIDKKPSYYSFADKTTTMTEADIMALFPVKE